MLYKIHASEANIKFNTSKLACITKIKYKQKRIRLH